MKNIIMVFMVLLFAGSVSADIQLWETTNLDGEAQTVTDHIFHQIDETNRRFEIGAEIPFTDIERIFYVARQKPITFELTFVIQALPFNLTNGAVDWCNASIISFTNDYDTSGNLVNSSRTIESYYFSGTTTLNTTTITKDIRDLDTIIADVKCHYTDLASLYEENVLVGRWTTRVPAFECQGCEEFTLEEVTDELGRQDEIFIEETSIYSKLQSIIGLNYQLWLIASWVFKIGALLFAMFLVFAGIYYIYRFFEDIARSI